MKIKKRKENRLTVVDDFGRALEIWDVEIEESIQDRGKTLKLFLKRGDVNKRLDGRLEWVCEHGVGHTISVPPQHMKDESWWVHGCDGCCGKMDERIKDFRESRR